MIPRFFIDRPIFAAVLSIVITLAGGDGGVRRCRCRAVPADHAADGPGRLQLSRRQRQVVVETVAAPIEQQVNGVEDMLYMSSQCTNDGSLQPDRHVQARRRPEHGPGAGAEPRQPGHAAAARRRSSRPA